MIGLLYLLTHYQKMGFTAVPPAISKTSLPQTWHVPQRKDGVTPQSVGSLKITKIKPVSDQQDVIKKKKRTAECVESNLYSVYCPLPIPLPHQEFQKALLKNLTSCGSDAQILKSLNGDIVLVDSKYGKLPKGSVLSYQQTVDDDASDIINDRAKKEPPIPPLPEQPIDYLYVLSEAEQKYQEGIDISAHTSIELERQTVGQGDSKTWHNVRSMRITSSKFKHIVVRQKDFETLALRYTCAKGIQTAAMKRGIVMEPFAAKHYAEITGNNVYRCGFIVNPCAPHLGTSPDRFVYDTSLGTYGLLEIKCPMNNSFVDCKYLEKVGVSLKLKRNHEYFYQVMGQLGLSGFLWADFVVKCVDDCHIERIYFNRNLYADMKMKLDKFYIEYFMPQLLKMKKGCK